MLKGHGNFSFLNGNEAVFLELFYGAVQCLNGNAAFFIQFLPGLSNDDLFFALDIQCAGSFQNVIQKNELGRIKESGAPVIGRAVEFKSDFP